MANPVFKYLVLYTLLLPARCRDVALPSAEGRYESNYYIDVIIPLGGGHPFIYILSPVGAGVLRQVVRIEISPQV